VTMPKTLAAWLWLGAFIVAAYFVWMHWAKPNLPGA